MLKNRIFGKIFSLTMLTALAASLFLLLITYRDHVNSAEKTVIEENELLAEVTANMVASGYVNAKMPFQTLKLISDSENVVFLWIVKPSGEIYFADNSAMFGKYIEDPETLASEMPTVKDALAESGEKVKLITRPLEMELGEQHWTLYLGASLKPIALVERNTIMLSLVAVVAIIFFAGVISYYFSKRITRPLEQLRMGAMIIGTGNLGHQIKIKTDDEIEELGRAFNQMARDLKSSRTALEESKAVAILANIYTPIIVVGKNNKITLLNSAAQKFLGLKSEDLGKKISLQGDFSLNNFKSVIRNEIVSCKPKINEPGNLLTEELRIKLNGEELVYKVITSRVLGEHKEPLGIIKIFYDLTRETAIDKLKSEFVSIAAHQLRTPLSAIKWIIKMILDGDVGQLNLEQEELLLKGYKSNERIIQLVDDLLDISRIEEGRFGYNFKYCSFENVLETAIDNSAALIAKSHIKIVIDKPKKLPEIYMDPERILLVLQNLLDNAIKYAPEFSQVNIKAEVMAKEKILKVIVKDQGVGIPLVDQPKLFSKFFRATNAVRLETEGTGLGLFIAKNIIEKHNGIINIKSEEGQGTEVFFSLPVAEAAKPITK